VSPDEITLTLPRERPFFRIAHLVLGGLAIRLDLTLEDIEDLQLAISSLLDRPTGPGDVTLTVRVEGEAIRAVVGPFPDGRLRAELAEAEGDGGALSLGRLLATVVDHVELDERDGVLWVGMTKSVTEASADG
jgi:hypothetical protein